MADYWTTPKVNWLTSDGIGYADLDRIEANISALRDATYRKVQKFGYSTSNGVPGKDGVLTVTPGSCYSENGFPIKMAADHLKNLTSWAEGNGTDFGGMASAVTVAAYTWYYTFVVMNPTDGSVDIQFDDNPDGDNISAGLYTEQRYIGAFKTGVAGVYGSFDLIETFSTGDDTFINPNSMYASRTIPYDTSDTPGSNIYALLTLTSGAEGFALPAREVKADLEISSDNVIAGIVSAYGNVFTTPTNLYASYPTPPAIGEFTQIWANSTTTWGVMFPSTRKFNLGIVDLGSGQLDIAVRGFHDERLI